MRKKLSATFITIFLVSLLIFCGCSGSEKQLNAKFEHFTEELFCQEVAADTITMHYTLQRPENFGIQAPAPSLGSYSTDSVAASAAVENCLAALDAFPHDKLSRENQLTYDVLAASLNSSLETAPYILYDEPLAPLTGIQAQLPVLLSEFQFLSAEDADTYLALLKDMPDYFDSLAAFEETKSGAGLFMPAYTADDIIKECDSFILMGNANYLYSTFDQRIEALSDLTPQEKEDYIARNETLIRECVFPAYEKLKQTLASLRTTGKNNNGLCHFPDGTAYYEYVVKRETGSNRTIPQLQDLTRRQMMEDLTAMQEILTAEAPTQEAAVLTLEDSNPSAILNELKGKLDDKFPAPADVTTQVKYIQKEMEAYLSPAFYMVPAIDNTSDNVIYINQGHIPDDLDLYTTLAHEGYPGHLYQTTYFAASDPDPLRSILNFGGYTEGWATYSEMLSYYYTTLDKQTATLMQRNSSVILGLYALADMGIHYDGWTLVDAVSFFHQYGISDTETIENIYDLIIADPGNYLKYYIGYVEFFQLKRDAMDAWGENFSQKRFHKAVLDAGPAPFAILRRYVLDT